ncbi:MAG: isoprenylcysteine carboxylmethyltransferase family protein [Syntrophomonadaceae bacterium]|nr:isoprenylcysteine carboxylmethyltransferase family protein [Syntrophomonadaceae bacterium]MDD3889509.1 isoprenylcysteine carboxylmethyltransferase family protein [Syntrophomonadaceae bacterium]MDD4548664.1 isoprenylcysteine carboxylmethyltransferase family protein [Syntrophomonadaceae bacterium]
MNSRKRNVLIRVILAVAVFIYIGNLAWQQLPTYDFTVMIGFFIIYFGWVVLSETMLYTDPDTYVIDDDDKKSYLYLQFSFFIALLYATIDFVELHYTRIYELEPVITIIGFIIFILSCVIRWWGFKSIGKFFNPRVSVYEDHQLITRGAYKSIRHPLYLGSLLNFISIPIVFNSWGALLIIVIATVPALGYRIKIEEEFLLRHFGEEYREYMQHTKKMIPGIW